MIRLAACIARQLPALMEVRTDGELLAAFLAARDEPAFVELVRRHGPLVWAACRRLLPDPADAEDAFQAAFLVLVRRAHRLTARAEIGPWLYRVAAWTARNVRRRNARMLARRSPLSPATADPAPGVDGHDLRADLDAALLSLPEKYRAPLVLCHLQGWSRREAAERLGCPEGTLSSLLSRGLSRLRVKLQDRDPAQALAIGAVAVPAVLASATVRAATAAPFVNDAISSTASQLAEGVLRMFWIKKATAASFGLIAVFGMGLGIGVSVDRMPGAAAGAGPAAAGVAADDNRVTLVQLERDVDLSAIDLEEAKRRLLLAEALIAGAQDPSNPEAFDRAKVRLAEAKKAHEQAQKEMERKTEYLRAVRWLAARAAEPKPDAELEKLQVQLDTLQVQINELQATLEAAKLRMVMAANAKDQKARDVAGREVNLIHELLLVARKQQQDLRDKLAQIEKQKKAAPVAQLLSRNLDDVAQKAKNQSELKDLEDRLAKLKAEQEALQAEAQRLNALRAETQRKMAELEAKRNDAAKLADLLVADRASLDLAIGTKDAAGPFAIREIGSDGKVVGTVSFENLAVLTRYINRTAKDPAAPKSVRIAANPDVKYETLKAVLDACKAAGLKQVTLNLKASAEADHGTKP